MRKARKDGDEDHRGWRIALICQRFPSATLLPPLLSPQLLPFTSRPVFSFQNGVVHRDLKLENILLDDNCNIKVKPLPC